MRDFWKKFTGHFLPGSDNAYRPHLLKKPWLLFFLTIILTAEGLYIAALATEESAQNFLSAVLPADVIALTNTERANVGDSSLRENATLALAAQNKANDMAAHGYFAHVGPDGKQPWNWISEAGYTYRAAGENLAVRFDNSADVVNAWMASPTHRANIVKPVYEEIGIGVAEGIYEGTPATFVVQYFGTPQSAAVSPAAAATVPAQPTVTSASAEPVPSVAGAETPDEPTVQPAATTTPAATPTPVAESQTTLQSESQTSVREGVQNLIRASEASQSSINWILGGVALFVLMLIALAVFVHIEIQPTEMLLGGAFVTAAAVSLFMLNATITEQIQTNGSQSASVVGAVSNRAVLLGREAAFTELGE